MSPHFTTGILVKGTYQKPPADPDQSNANAGMTPIHARGCGSIYPIAQ